MLRGIAAAQYPPASVKLPPLSAPASIWPIVPSTTYAPPPLRLPPPSALHLTEMDPGPDDLWLDGPEGRYASEFLVQLEHAGGTG